MRIVQKNISETEKLLLSSKNENYLRTRNSLDSCNNGFYDLRHDYGFDKWCRKIKCQCVSLCVKALLVNGNVHRINGDECCMRMILTQKTRTNSWVVAFFSQLFLFCERINTENITPIQL